MRVRAATTIANPALTQTSSAIHHRCIDLSGKAAFWGKRIITPAAVHFSYHSDHAENLREQLMGVLEATRQPYAF